MPIPNSQESLFNNFDLSYKGFHDMRIEHVTQFNHVVFKRHTRINPHPNKQPILGLASLSKWTNARQKEEAQKYVERNTRAVSINYAGDVCEIYVSDDINLLTDSRNVYKNFKKSQEFGRWCNGIIDETGKENGKSIKGSRVMVEHILDHLKYLTNVKNIRIDRIMIFALFKAGRAETFKSSDRKWILTKLFLDLPKSSHRENIIQRFRMWGQYNFEEVPQHVHQTFYIKEEVEKEITEILDDKFNFQLRLINTKTKIDTLRNLLRNVDKLPLYNDRKFTRSSLETKEVMGYKREKDLRTGIIDLENSREKIRLTKEMAMKHYKCEYEELKELTRIESIEKRDFIQWVKTLHPTLKMCDCEQNSQDCRHTPLTRPLDAGFTGFKTNPIKELCQIESGNYQKLNKYLKAYLKANYPSINQGYRSDDKYSMLVARNDAQEVRARNLIKTLRCALDQTDIVFGLNKKTNVKSTWYFSQYIGKANYTTNESGVYEDGFYIRHDYNGELIVTKVYESKNKASDGIKHLQIKC